MNLDTEWDFSLYLRVWNPEMLYEAAAAHPDCVDAAELKDVDGSVNIPACLGILLDPGSLPGCSIHQHEVKEV